MTYSYGIILLLYPSLMTKLKVIETVILLIYTSKSHKFESLETKGIYLSFFLKLNLYKGR